MKQFILIVLLFHTNNLFAQNSITLRNELFLLELNSDSIQNYLDKLTLITDPSPEVISYKGASCAFLAKYISNPIKKIYYLNQSNKYLNLAVKLKPDDVEIRFIRFLTKSQVPVIFSLGYDLADDKQFIIANIDAFQMKGLTSEMGEFITGFLFESRYCSYDEAITLSKGLTKTL